jgi:hypothetical protein
MNLFARNRRDGGEGEAAVAAEPIILTVVEPEGEGHPQRPAPNIWQYPSHLTNAFAVSWQEYSFAEMTAQLERDIEPDFQWWLCEKDYDPLSLAHQHYFRRPISWTDFAPDADAYFGGTALQIDLLRPQADYLNLSFPGAAEYFLLSVDEYAAQTFANYPELGQQWLGLTSTTHADHAVSAYRRTIFFPKIEGLNKSKGTHFVDITPSWQFARAFQDWLNEIGVGAIEGRHWVLHFSDKDAPGYYAFDGAQF